MVDTVGERRSSFKPKPPEDVRNVSIGPRPGLTDRAKLTVAAFIAALGLGGGAVVANGGAGAAEAVGGALDKAAHIGMETPQHAATQQVREQLESKGIHFGDVLDEAVYTDQETGKDGVAWQHGSLGDISISGTVGVKTAMQGLNIRDEASTDGSLITVDDLKKKGVNLGDVWMVPVHGGPINVVPGEEPKEKRWVMFAYKDEGEVKKAYAKEEFAVYDDQKPAFRLEQHAPLNKSNPPNMIDQTH